MGYWLVKTEPGTYSWADLVREKKAVWDGVSNAAALKNLRAMKKGDLVLVYHTGDEKRVVGVAEVSAAAYPDPKADDEKLVAVDLKPKKPLQRPVTLAEVKADKAFAGWDLIRIGRLSVVPVPEPMWERVMELGGAA
jgi:predicted RNA-binding protein with PUA-like domain